MSRSKPSIYDVARQAGVSIATVSRVLRGSGPAAPETRERVLAAAQELDWRPSRLASGLAGRGHHAVGVVFPDLMGPYFAQVLLGFEQQAVADDRSVLILATHGRENSDVMVTDLADRVDGLVVMDRTVSDEVVRTLDRADVPLVLLARPAVDDLPAVRTDNLLSATRLTAHLLGHQRGPTAFLGDPDAAPDVLQRWEGFRRAHDEAGLSAPEKPVRCGFRPEDGYAAALSVLDGEHPPATLCCANDDVALGVYTAARDTGRRIGRDLLVAGWDDNPAAEALHPSLTTVRQPSRELGHAAGEALSARIRGTPTPSRTLPSQLVIRGSCGCTQNRTQGARP